MELSVSTRESFLAMVGESEVEPEPGDSYVYVSNRPKDQFKTPSLSDKMFSHHSLDEVCTLVHG